jgi:hypothetical protein
MARKRPARRRAARWILYEGLLSYRCTGNLPRRNASGVALCERRRAGALRTYGAGQSGALVRPCGESSARGQVGRRAPSSSDRLATVWPIWISGSSSSTACAWTRPVIAPASALPFESALRVWSSSTAGPPASHRREFGERNEAPRRDFQGPHDGRALRALFFLVPRPGVRASTPRHQFCVRTNFLRHILMAWSGARAPCDAALARPSRSNPAVALAKERASEIERETETE